MLSSVSAAPAHAHLSCNSSCLHSHGSVPVASRGWQCKKAGSADGSVPALPGLHALQAPLATDTRQASKLAQEPSVCMRNVCGPVGQELLARCLWPA